MWKNIGKGGIWFAVYFALQNIVSIVVAIGYLALNLDNLPNMEDADALVNFVLEVLMSTVMPTMIICSLLFILIYAIHRRVIKEPLHIQSVEWDKLVFFAGLSLVLNVVLNGLLTVLEGFMPNNWLESLDQSVGLASTGQPMWILLLGTGVLVPIMEELTFRYGMHGYIAKSNVIVAYIVSSILFGLMHGNPIQIAYAAIFGFVLAFIYQKTGNIWYPIIIHIGNNTSSLIAAEMSLWPYIITFTCIGLALMAFTYTRPNVKAMFMPKNAENFEHNVSSSYDPD